MVTQHTSRQAEAESPLYQLDSTHKNLTTESSWDEILAELQQIKNQLDQIKGANPNANPHQN